MRPIKFRTRIMKFRQIGKQNEFIKHQYLTNIKNTSKQYYKRFNIFAVRTYSQNLSINHNKIEDLNISELYKIDSNCKTYFDDLESNIKIYNANHIVELLHKIVHFQKENASDCFEILLKNHQNLFEQLISKINKQFRDINESHLLLFELMCYLNLKFNFNKNNQQFAISELCKINIFKIYNRCRRVLTKGDESYYSEIFKQNAPLRQNIIEKNTKQGDDSTYQRFITDNYLYKLAEFFIKNAFINPFGSRIEQLHPLYVNYNSTNILYCLAALCSTNDFSKSNQSMIDLLIDKFNQCEDKQLFEKESIIKYPQFHSSLCFLENVSNNVIKYTDIGSINPNLKSLYTYVLQTVLNQIINLEENQSSNSYNDETEIGCRIKESDNFLVIHPYTDLQNILPSPSLSKSQIMDMFYRVFNLPGVKRVLTDVVEVDESNNLCDRLESFVENQFQQNSYENASYQLKKHLIERNIWNSSNFKDFTDYFYNGGNPNNNIEEAEIILEHILKELQNVKNLDSLFDINLDKEQMNRKYIQIIYNFRCHKFKHESLDKIEDYLVLKIFNKRTFDILNREHINSGGILDDFMGQDFSFENVASSIKDKIPNDLNLKSMIENPSEIKQEISKIKDITDEMFTSVRSSFEKAQSKLAHKNKPLSSDKLATCIQFFCSLLNNQVPSEDLHKQQFVIDFSISLCLSIDSEFIIENTELIQKFIIQMHELNILNKRIKEIGKSPYSIIEPMIIENWNKGVFTDEFRYVYRSFIYTD